MSEVWAATDLELDRSVAVKLLASDADPARFEREARAAAGLAHANVCALYDYGEADGRRFMVLELLPGGPLEDRLAGNRPLPDGETRRIATEVAAGLAHAHQRGVVHRDLKPANILFDAQDRAKIADFGIARAGGANGLTEVGTVMGTAAYISPEQARGEPATPASDVYAFGVILFRMLTGRLPFSSPDAIALAAMHRDLPAPPVSELRPDAPPLLESLAGAALAKSPADRPQDGAALVAELRHAGPPSDEATAVTQIVPPPTTRRKRLLLALAVAVVAAAGVGLAMAVTLSNGTTPTPVSTSQPSTTTAPSPTPPPPPEPSAPLSTSTGVATATRATTTSAATTAPVTSQPVTTRPATTSPATTRVTTAPVTTAPPPTTTGAPTAPTVTTVPATTTGSTPTSPATTTTAASTSG